MKGVDLRQARRSRGWTQQEMARRMSVSQGYVSLLERGVRAVPRRLAPAVRRAYGLPPTTVPLTNDVSPLSAALLPNLLAALRYPGYAYARSGTRQAPNPAQLLVRMLRQDNLESRMVEALPWLLLQYLDLDWGWLLEQAKLHDLQNRLGYLVALTRQVALRVNRPDVAGRLAHHEATLERSRLAREDTLCHESMTQAERRWLRSHRPPDAARWNLLTDLAPEHLSYAT